MELHERWLAAGHLVEHFSFSEAFPTKNCSALEYAMRRILFPHRAASFVRQNAGRFDVIDALIGSLFAPKRKLHFDGLLVARSVGSHRLYDQFERSVSKRWPGRSPGTFAGRIFHSGVNNWLNRGYDAALRHADLINVPNTAEAAFLKEQLTNPIIVQPYGLASELKPGPTTAADKRLAGKTISFVGMWTPRKGCRVWGEIIRRVRERIPDAQFRFLGTMVTAEVVLGELGQEHTGYVRVVSEFAPNDLPDLLSDCAVGAFPSYIEGFGLAILEQLACGIPTVAFDQGGPHDILSDKLSTLLVPTGDVEGFASALVRTLRLDPADYQQLVRASMETAQQYDWSEIADDTLEHYRSALAHV